MATSREGTATLQRQRNRATAISGGNGQAGRSSSSSASATYNNTCLLLLLSTRATLRSKNAEKVQLVSVVLNVAGLFLFLILSFLNRPTFSLKLRCDRTIPCSSCVKRGCGAICPDVGLQLTDSAVGSLVCLKGSLTTGQGNRWA